MVAGGRWADPRVSQIADLLGFSCNIISGVCRERPESPIALLSDVGVKLPRKGQHQLKGKHLTYSGKHARRSTIGSDVNLYALVS